MRKKINNITKEEKYEFLTRPDFSEELVRHSVKIGKIIIVHIDERPCENYEDIDCDYNEELCNSNPYRCIDPHLILGISVFDEEKNKKHTYFRSIQIDWNKASDMYKTLVKLDCLPEGGKEVDLDKLMEIEVKLYITELKKDGKTHIYFDNIDLFDREPERGLYKQNERERTPGVWN